jgi:hypothetical protein
MVEATSSRLIPTHAQLASSLVEARRLEALPASWRRVAMGRASYSSWRRLVHRLYKVVQSLLVLKIFFTGDRDVDLLQTKSGRYEAAEANPSIRLAFCELDDLALFSSFIMGRSRNTRSVPSSHIFIWSKLCWDRAARGGWS